MKKFFVSLLVLSLFAGGVFTLGWTALFMPRETVGVLSSKTGGVDQTPVMPGVFAWHWERIIPTNAEVLSFSLPPRERTLSVTGTLPSGERYAAMLGGKQSFSWKASCEVSFRVSANRLPALVRDLGIRDQAALDSWADERIGELAESAVSSAVAAAIASAVPSTLHAGSNPAIEADVSGRLSSQQNGLEIVSVSVTLTDVPDVALYEATAAAWNEYTDRRNARLFSAATVEAEAAFAEYLQFERFERLGELLTKYPVLVDYLAVMKGEETEALKALRTYR